MSKLEHDVRVTLRGLASNPSFSLAVILTIALGVGINTATFSVVHAVLLAPLPYPDADRLTFITMGRESDGSVRRPLSGPELADIARGSSLHAGMGAIFPTEGTLVEDGQPQPLSLAIVTTPFLPLFGVPPIRGGWFKETADGRSAEPSMILNASLWYSRFGGADVIGRRVRLDGGWGFDGGVYTIVGVMPPGFEMLMPIDSDVPRTVDAWISYNFDYATLPRNTFSLRVLGRVAPNASVAAAREEVERVGVTMMARFKNYLPGRKFFAVPLKDDVIKKARTPLIVLQAAVALVLLIACANVANLLLVRARSRSKEIGVRLALGAPTAGVVRLLFLESVILVIVAGALGVGIAAAGLRMLPLLAPDTLPRLNAATLNRPVLIFSMVATVGSGLLFGLAAFMQAHRADVVTLLKRDSYGSRRGLRGWQNALVVSELALSLVLLVGAGLLAQSFVRLQRVDPGYRSDHMLTFRLPLPFERYGQPADTSRVARQLEDEIRAVPGVQSAGIVNQLPLQDGPSWSMLYRTRVPAQTRENVLADARLVTGGYFEALKVALVQGRWFTPHDDEQQPLVLVVDEKLARRAWPNQDAVGQELGITVWTFEGFRPRWGRVVGVVKHLRHHEPSSEVREEVFVPFTQAPRNQMAVVVRSEREPGGVMRDVRRAIARVDPLLGVTTVGTLDEAVARKEAPARFSMALAMLFAAFAALFASLGVYAVLAYVVAQRTPELAVRAALGAGRPDLVRLVLRHGVRLLIAGLAVGLAVALMAVRSMQSLLFGVTALDPATFAGAVILLAVTALAAGYISARRVASIDPATLLRSE
jgi:putative ABC transport system permease protein